jgi:Mg-chelatase subunit ChlD
MPAPLRQAGLLTAGEWRDLDHWGFWRGLFNVKRQGTSQWRDMQRTWGLALRDRVSLKVRSGNDLATNASVYLYDADGKTIWTARSDNEGMAHLFPQRHKGPFSVCAAVPGAAVKQDSIELARGVASLDLSLNPASQSAAHGLDIMFMVDTTGSMGDELSYLQSELRNVLTRVQKANANADIRTSVNFYRDFSDAYVVRPFAFTRDINKARKQIAAQSANGGGDFPEAVDQALTNAIFEHKWRKDAKARILFLVLDAPPHQQKAQLARVRTAIKQAAKQGIRIVPVAGSGINKPTEFLMRFAAVATGGTYAFLTDDSGIGNSHLKPTIGKHKVQKLNRLLVKIINRYAE